MMKLFCQCHTSGDTKIMIESSIHTLPLILYLLLAQTVCEIFVLIGLSVH